MQLLIRDCTTSLEAQHELTLGARRLAADIVAAQGRPAEAEQVMRAVVDDALPHHGTGSTMTRPLSLMARFVRADALAALGNGDVAKSEHAVVHAARLQLLGPSHPDTLASQAAM